jgi:hypothetical protein
LLLLLADRDLEQGVDARRLLVRVAVVVEDAEERHRPAVDLHAQAIVRAEPVEVFEDAFERLGRLHAAYVEFDRRHRVASSMSR